MAVPLVACAAAQQASTPASAPAGSGRPVVTHEPAPAPGDSGPRVPSVSVPGTTYGQVSSESTALPYHVRWPQLPGASALTEAVAAQAKSSLDSFLADSVPGGVAPPELNLTGEVTLASGLVAGVRLTAYEFYGASGETRHASFYGAADGSWGVPAVELVAPERRAALVERVRVAVAPSADPDGQDPTPSAERVLRDVIVRLDGALTVVVDEGLLAPNSAGTPSVTVPAAEVGALLSARGRQVVEAVTSPEPYAAPAATSAAPPSSLPGPRPRVDCSVAKCVALTYDDGPGPQTDRLLTELAAQGARATFFVLGPNARAHPDTVRRAVSLGMAVGNHTWSHRELTRLTPQQVRDEVERTARAVRAVTGAAPTMLRPPYGAQDATVRAQGLPVVLWDVDTEDWRNRSASVTTSKVLAGVHPGAIVLMHDIHPSSVAATPGIVRELTKRGYALVTVPELVGSMRPGQVISRGPSPR